jgi:hypothetical protein
MKAVVGKEMMTIINLVLLTTTTRIISKELFHQEGLSQLSTKISFFAIIFLENNLVIKN